MGRRGNDTKKQSINFDRWMVEAIEKIAEEKEMTFTSVIHDLLRQELSFMGYSPGIGRESVYRRKDVNENLSVHEPEPEYGQEIEVRHPEQFDNNVVSINYDILYIPFFGQAAAGKPIDFDIPAGRVVPWPKDKIKGDAGRYFTVQVKGTSMTGAGIMDGDYVLMRHAEAPRQNRIMLVRHENESTVKRIKIKGDIEVYMCWEDGSDQTVRLDSVDYEIQGEFVSVMRG